MWVGGRDAPAAQLLQRGAQSTKQGPVRCRDPSEPPAELKQLGFLSDRCEPRAGMLLLVGVVVATVVVRMNGARVLSGELDSSI